MQKNSFLYASCFILVSLATQGHSQVDSSALLFDDDAVRAYTLDFYSTDWATQLASNWATDSGYIPAKFSDGVITLDSVGVRYKGNSSYSGVGTSPKKPYKIKFNEYRSGQTYYGSKILNFSNGYGDPSFLREKIAYDISRKYLPTPRVNFATITVGSTLIGLYTQVEQIDKIFLESNFTDATQNLFKASDNGASLLYEGIDPTLYADDLELKTNENANDWSGMIRFLYFINNASDSLFCEAYQSYLNKDNVTKFLAFNMVLSHFDSYTGSGRNFYLYQQTASGYMLFVPWDMNLAFGGYSNGWNVYTQSALTISNSASRPLTAKMLACPDLKYQYLGYIRDMIQTYASTDSVQAAIDRLVPIIRPVLNTDPNKFFTITAFDSNLTTKYRTSSGSIPGLIEFSTTRNAALLAEVADSLPTDFVLPVKASTGATSLQLLRGNNVWVLAGATAADLGSLKVFGVNGRQVKFRASLTTQGVMLQDLPQGILFVRLGNSSHQLVKTINNH